MQELKTKRLYFVTGIVLSKRKTLSNKVAVENMHSTCFVFNVESFDVEKKADLRDLISFLNSWL